MPSLENQNDFRLVKRVLIAVNPNYTIYTHLEMPAGQSRLDTERRTIVISDATDIQKARIITLFQIGHVRHPFKDPGQLDDAGMAQYLAKQDKQAADWAFKVHMALWPESHIEDVENILKQLVSSAFDWIGWIK